MESMLTKIPDIIQMVSLVLTAITLAADMAPYPVDWNDRNRFFYLAGIVKGCAARLGLKVRWGGDFNQDQNFRNDSFVDLPHFELVGNKNA